MFLLSCKKIHETNVYLSTELVPSTSHFLWHSLPAILAQNSPDPSAFCLFSLSYRALYGREKRPGGAGIEVVLRIYDLMWISTFTHYRNFRETEKSRNLANLSFAKFSFRREFMDKTFANFSKSSFLGAKTFANSKARGNYWKESEKNRFKYLNFFFKAKGKHNILCKNEKNDTFWVLITAILSFSISW